MSKYIVGIHEPCPLEVMPEGWVLHIAEVGDSDVPHPGIDLGDDPRTPMVRIQWKFGPEGGCYPPPRGKEGFIGRVGFLVRNTPDCHIWQAGNEPNHQVEGLFEPEYTAQMYSEIRTAVRTQAGHEEDCVLLPPIAPWNATIGYGWIEYFERVIALCRNIDGFALHTYARGSNLDNITDPAKMGAPYEAYYSNFQTYRDWMAAIPYRYQTRPVYITEFDENGPWVNAKTGIVQAAYKEIDAWNQDATHQKIRCLMLYRWPSHDKYYIAGKQGVIDDFLAAQSHGYTWQEEDPPMADEWRVLHQNRCEQGFYDWVINGTPVGELTFPNGTVVHYIQGNHQGSFNRVEADAKDATLGHPEVAEGRFSAALMWRSSTGRAGFVSDPVYVVPGKPVRGHAQYQHILDGGAGGARMGIVMGGPGDPFSTSQIGWPVDGPDPFNDDSIAWGDWVTSRGSNGLPNRQWVTLATKEVVPPGDYVRFVCQFNADDAGNSMAGIFDVMTVEQYGEGTQPPEPPTPGTCSGATPAEVRAIVADELTKLILKAM